DQSMAALARLGSAAPTAGGSRPAPLDDDPLTSPSFPAVGTADSRSYRSGRSDNPRGSDGSRGSGSYGVPGSYAAGNGSPAGQPLASPAVTAPPPGYGNGSHSAGRSADWAASGYGQASPSAGLPNGSTPSNGSALPVGNGYGSPQGGLPA